MNSPFARRLPYGVRKRMVRTDHLVAVALRSRRVTLLVVLFPLLLMALGEMVCRVSGPACLPCVAGP